MSLKRSVFYTAAVQFPSVLLGFSTGVLITRLLHEVGRGYYTLLQSDVVLLVMLLSLNMGSGMVYFLAKGKGSKGEVIGIAVSGLLIVGAILSALLAWSWLYGIPANPLLPIGLNGFFFASFLAISLFLGLLHSLFVGIFLGLHLFRVVNQMTLVSSILLFSVYAMLFWRLPELDVMDKLRWTMLAGMGAQLFVEFLWFFQYIKHVRVKPVLFRSGAILVPLLAFATTGYVANILNQLNYRLDIWFLQDLRGAGELGLYAVAVGVAQFFFQIPEPLSQVLQPHLIGDTNESGLKQFKLYARLSFTLVLLGGIVLMLISDWLFPFIYGSAFAGSSTAFQLLMPGILFACGSKMMVLMVIRSGKVKYNVLASGIGLLFTIALNILLVPHYGLMGAAVASTVAYAVVFLVVLWVVFCRMGVPYGNYFILMPKDLMQLIRR